MAESRAEYKVYVGNMCYDTDENSLKELFEGKEPEKTGMDVDEGKG